MSLPSVLEALSLVSFALPAKNLAGGGARPGAQSRIEPDLDDATLVARILGGDRWAEEALYRRYFDLVTATAVRLLRNRAEAEDVVQETFLIVFKDLGRLRETRALRGWVVQIAVSRAHRRFRARRLRRLLGAEVPLDATLELCASSEASPEVRAELGRLDAVLDAISANERVAWTLRCVLGLPLEEVAAAAGCSLATVKRRIAAAHAKITAEVAIAVPGSDAPPGGAE